MLLVLPVITSQANEKNIKIAIIIDDIGTNLAHGNRVLKLPNKVALSILPFTRYAKTFAQKASQSGHPVLVHIPMEAESNNELLGPGALRENMEFWAFIKQLRKDLVSLPQAEGVNNHMGSKLTKESTQMQWLMALLKWQNLYFIDSRTTKETVAEKAAHQFGVKATSRDVFLDDNQNQAAINYQFDRLLSIAKKQGSAVAIGHPHDETLKVLEQRLPELKSKGVELVSIRELITHERPYNKSKITIVTASKSNPSPSAR